ncbi:hypothetical protein Ae168Ps1_6030 [Pseudonocardia sp. Ae168_Ps1]|nr:hypothetical protein Ae150APs1_5975 [Pseudonocardia sp. Ae150A_Ps1]OLL70565.1 hypothetical protein Ae168Ps1_6030 [Pseudonocardia sp. Ae168_Ps1]OLL70789.1 hypothetical protein Ae263Ps1_6203 [Pseudonocardia sp. Ae263_Ps1]OLL89345.1 hypothetical protein Ae356Ps1_6089 [Pseudonocardia sp. Ae356_Ps1]OLL89827.1 hypothetical protein Ae331Ps2_6163c [Pseudonocardia sp. Ae331_Ps2]OLM09769.1 hypothetical protein Ae706Ps2_6231c [Pseudonocardia sp. Ae706_Ps2]
MGDRWVSSGIKRVYDLLRYRPMKTLTPGDSGVELGSPNLGDNLI